MGLLVDGVWTDQWYDTSSIGCVVPLGPEINLLTPHSREHLASAAG
jgi:glutathionyl-hydroquinone reductase